MNVERQVVSLELSKCLDDLKVYAPSLFYWYLGINGYNKLRPSDWEPEVSGDRPIAAYTVAELGEMMPENQEKWYITYSMEDRESSTYSHGKYCTNFNSFLLGYSDYMVQAHTEANSRAKMIIFLLEQGLYNPS